MAFRECGNCRSFHVAAGHVWDDHQFLTYGDCDNAESPRAITTANNSCPHFSPDLLRFPFVEPGLQALQGGPALGVGAAAIQLPPKLAPGALQGPAPSYVQ